MVSRKSVSEFRVRETPMMSLLKINFEQVDNFKPFNKVLNSALEKDELRGGGEGGVSIKKIHEG